MRHALLIDDELSARADLRAKLAAHPEVGIVGEAATVDRARALLAEAADQLDVEEDEVVGGLGFDLVPDVHPAARIVFVTAYDRFALRAIEVNALDYLLKPIKPERLAQTLARAAGRERGGAAPVPAPGRLRAEDTVYVRTDSGARFLPLAEIGAIQSCENYSEIDLVGGERLLVRQTLKAWEDQLPSPPFARAHRQVLVNLECLVRLEDDGGDAPLLHLRGLRAPVRASRREWTDLRHRLPDENGQALRLRTGAGSPGFP